MLSFIDDVKVEERKPQALVAAPKATVAIPAAVPRVRKVRAYLARLPNCGEETSRAVLHSWLSI